MKTPSAFEVQGNNATALFSLKIFRGEGMVLLGMNWLNGKPPINFVGFAIEYKEPSGTQFYPIKNRISFLENDGNVNPNILSSRLSPIQKFRWIHFPFNTDLPGDFTYKVTPVFMDDKNELSYGDPQQAVIELQSETYPEELNIAFTRGFVASQAFVDKFQSNNNSTPLLPPIVKGEPTKSLAFVSKNSQANAAYDWMGFKARTMILNLLDEAIKDSTAQVRVTAYDFDEPEILSRLIKLGKRLKIVIDDSGTKPSNYDKDIAEKKLKASAGVDNVQRQHMGDLQHSKTIAVNGNNVKSAICGSTNFSWRGLFVQNNNALIVHGAVPVKLFFDAFDNLWTNLNNPKGFSATSSAVWNDLKLPGVNAKISFSPHNSSNTLLAGIGQEIDQTTSSLLYSLAFLYETKGSIKDAIEKITENNKILVYGISDKSVGGLDLQKPDGNPPVVFPASLLKSKLPEPFKSEVTIGSGVRMHHKFIVIDFNKPTARVYLGSYNFSSAADMKNAENLVLIQDRRVAVAYMIEAVSMFDHYEFRDAVSKSATTNKLYLHLPPRRPKETAWWEEDYTNKQKIHDRELFS